MADQSQGQQGQDTGQDEPQGQQDEGDGQDDARTSPRTDDGQDDGRQECRTSPGSDEGQDDGRTGRRTSPGSRATSQARASRAGRWPGPVPGARRVRTTATAPASPAATRARTSGERAQKALQEVLSAGEEDLPEDTFEEVAKRWRNTKPRTEVLLPSLEQYDGDHDAGRAALRRVRGESAKLTARLQGLVQASQMTATRTVRRGNRLDPTKLYRAAVRDDRVFARK